MGFLGNLAAGVGYAQNAMMQQQGQQLEMLQKRQTIEQNAQSIQMNQIKLKQAHDQEQAQQAFAEKIKQQATLGQIAQGDALGKYNYYQKLADMAEGSGDPVDFKRYSEMAKTALDEVKTQDTIQTNRQKQIGETMGSIGTAMATHTATPEMIIKGATFAGVPVPKTQEEYNNLQMRLQSSSTGGRATLAHMDQQKDIAIRESERKQGDQLRRLMAESTLQNRALLQEGRISDRQIRQDGQKIAEDKVAMQMEEHGYSADQIKSWRNGTSVADIGSPTYLTRTQQQTDAQRINLPRIENAYRTIVQMATEKTPQGTFVKQHTSSSEDRAITEAFLQATSPTGRRGGKWELAEIKHLGGFAAREASAIYDVMTQEGRTLPQGVKADMVTTVQEKLQATQSQFKQDIHNPLVNDTAQSSGVPAGWSVKEIK